MCQTGEPMRNRTVGPCAHWAARAQWMMLKVCSPCVLQVRRARSGKARDLRARFAVVFDRERAPRVAVEPLPLCEGVLMPKQFEAAAQAAPASCHRGVGGPGVPRLVSPGSCPMTVQPAMAAVKRPTCAVGRPAFGHATRRACLAPGAESTSPSGPCRQRVPSVEPDPGSSA